MKKLLLLTLTAGVLVVTGCRKRKETVVIKEDYSDEYYDNHGRPAHDHSTTVKKDGKVVKYVQKSSPAHKTHVEIE